MVGPASRTLDISVVIPTRERFPVLERTLAGLGAQDLDGVRAEVIVVDNDSRDGSRERAERLAGSASAPAGMRVLHEPARGAAAARNAGAAAAGAPVVLFLGDDCPPLVDGLVAGHARAHDGSARAVVGHIEWESGVEVTPVMRWLEDTGKMLDYGRLAHEPPGPYLFYTGNTSVDRAALLAAGGFDQRFQGYGWEDYELALRLVDAGLEVSYLPELRVGHAHRYGLADSLARMHAMGRSAELLNRLHADRRPPPAPRPRGLKAAAGRAVAPVAMRSARLERLPAVLARPWFKVAHWSALASGYGRAPLPAEDELRGGAAPRPGRSRPAASVIVPFHGSPAEGKALVGEVSKLELRPDDELIVVDNTEGGALPVEFPGGRVIHATAERSSYHARNAGAEAAGREWMLFVDADCRLRPDLLDAILAEPPAGDVGAVAGAVTPAAGQTARVARYAASRGHLGQAAHMAHPFRPFAITANLLVRRAAWEDAGGFLESIRSSGDADFSWRIQELGWRLEYRPEAVVEHRHRETVRALVRQNLRYGAGRAWITRQHPGSFQRPRVMRRLARAVAGAGWWAVTLRGERAAFSLLDALVIVTETAGWTLSNSSVRPAPRVPPGSTGTPLVLVADRFPELSETFVAGELHGLLRAGRHVRVEAASRPVRPNRSALRGLRVDYLTDDGLLRRLGATAALVGRHPWRTLADLAARSRWRREEVVRSLRSLAPRARRIAGAGERHLHAHFADTAALDALRLGRLLGLPFSMSAHAYDIFRDVRNLRVKLGDAAFATGESQYATDHLRSVADGDGTVLFLPAGVDGERFRRRRPYPGGRTVLAVGRLVEKKGFDHLVEAVGLLGAGASVERLVIAGAGPLGEALEQAVRERGLEGLVELPGAVAHEQVRELLEEADVFAMPSVVAADGDRDSMPNVVYEALAMAVPVVATSEVGLPEVVRPEWGRLVPPADPPALAAALSELLGLPPSERAAMGERGREWVLSERDVAAQAARLADWVDAAQGQDLTPRRAPSAQ